MELKPQDLFFIVFLGLLLYKRNPKHFVIAGIGSLVLSIPLYYRWIFFTAERLVLYAFVFFLIAVLLNLWNLRHNK